jgi:hypothetical protein
MLLGGYLLSSGMNYEDRAELRDEIRSRMMCKLSELQESISESRGNG